MEDGNNISPIQQYERSVRDFETRQGNDAKEINMTTKSKDGIVDKLRSRFNKINNNNVIGHSKLESKVRWISTERVCIGMAILMLISIGSFSWGISNNDQAEKKLAETNRQISETKSVVHGNHLENIPKNYSDWAAGESIKKKEAAEKDEADVFEKSEETVEGDVPAMPADKSEVVYDTYAERHLQYEEDLKMKAKESPIAFEIKKDK